MGVEKLHVTRGGKNIIFRRGGINIVFGLKYRPLEEDPGTVMSGVPPWLDMPLLAQRIVFFSSGL
jgi:hypothetical protein